MKKLVSTLNLSHEEWLKYRKQGLGGSDAGAICGLNPYASPMSVYYDKIREDTEETDNEAMRQGRDLEDYVARRFMEATGKRERRANAIFQSEAHPFMLSNVDRMVAGERAGLECKTANSYQLARWKDGAIPAHYLIQCFHYMAVTGSDAWYLAVVILGREFQYRKILRDDEMIENLIQIESDFWNNHVLAGVMPEPDGSESCEEILKKYYPSANRQTILLPEALNQQLKRREEILELTKRLQTEQKQIEQEVKLYMKENETAVGNLYRVNWSNVETAKLDTKRLKIEEPEIYRKYSVGNAMRRFTVRAA
ncbi:YqaJ viral recombinase family protein [Clostridium transplantifaecale]|uniref:YqaJ viral recombinase family nuclease n=1 Tax=Clostridium transplantifaecale TaxID=2479838 RepID=UPI000F635CE3|nr:YqaJ viral recombinase family protein [Clostridium transplantifaecale]